MKNTYKYILLDSDFKKTGLSLSVASLSMDVIFQTPKVKRREVKINKKLKRIIYIFKILTVIIRFISLSNNICKTINIRTLLYS